MRRRQVFVPLPPRRLLEFRESDWWPATDDTAWQMWSDARFEYLLERRGETLDGKDLVDLVFEDPPWSAQSKTVQRVAQLQPPQWDLGLSNADQDFTLRP